MEQEQKFQLKLSVYKKALQSFFDTLQIDIQVFSPIVQDAIKNGRIQKFEYTTEMTWKLIKKYLYIFHNIDAKSPTQSVKEFFNINMVDEFTYEEILKMIEMRNRLSHIYREDYFEEIHSQLNHYYQIMQEVERVVSEDI
jgi:nucleotidyltransferase substrate binding protein (TIGR01987 family)